MSEKINRAIANHPVAARAGILLTVAVLSVGAVYGKDYLITKAVTRSLTAVPDVYRVAQGEPTSYENEEQAMRVGGRIMGAIASKQITFEDDDLRTSAKEGQTKEGVMANIYDTSHYYEDGRKATISLSYTPERTNPGNITIYSASLRVPEHELIEAYHGDAAIRDILSVDWSEEVCNQDVDGRVKYPSCVTIARTTLYDDGHFGWERYTAIPNPDYREGQPDEISRLAPEEIIAKILPPQ